MSMKCVRFKKDTLFCNVNRKSGDIIRITTEDADSLVKLGVANYAPKSEYKPKKKPVIEDRPKTHAEDIGFEKPKRKATKKPAKSDAPKKTAKKSAVKK